MNNEKEFLFSFESISEAADIMLKSGVINPLTTNKNELAIAEMLPRFMYENNVSAVKGYVALHRIYKGENNG